LADATSRHVEHYHAGMRPASRLVVAAAGATLTSALALVTSAAATGVPFKFLEHYPPGMPTLVGTPSIVEHGLLERKQWSLVAFTARDQHNGQHDLCLFVIVGPPLTTARAGGGCGPTPLPIQAGLINRTGRFGAVSERVATLTAVGVTGTRTSLRLVPGPSSIGTKAKFFALPGNEGCCEAAQLVARDKAGHVLEELPA
jgi:hypothetical protein